MISAIAAIGKENRVIGNKGQIPWHISEDFKYFKETTSGHPIIMGRKTFETFKSPLPGRTHIVITRDKNYKASNGVIIVDSVANAIVEAVKQEGGQEIFIIGGGQIYEAALPFVDRLYLTLVDGKFEGDAFFPDYSEFKKEISSRDSEEGSFRYRFVVLEK
ncbi:dihydrofolate reductase [Candidatus Pacebacteria bacterium]|nr:dihydrofolate reductase [Candidatus Paceibacterota bacterium]